MTDHRTIAEILAMLKFRCPGRHPLKEITEEARSNKEADELRESMMKFWLVQLQDLDASVLLAATVDLCGAPGAWNPSVGDIRQRAVELSLGHLAPPSPGEAWANVCRWAKDPSNVQLTEDERAAADRAGGCWELKNSNNLTTTRAHFLKFYDEIVKKRVMTRRAHPAARLVADHNRPALPPKKPENRDCEPLGELRGHRNDPEVVSRLLDQLPGYREQYPEEK